MGWQVDELHRYFRRLTCYIGILVGQVSWLHMYFSGLMSYICILAYGWVDPFNKWLKHVF